MVNVAFPPDLRSNVTMPPVLVYVPSILDPHATLANATNNTTPPSIDLRAVFMFLPFLLTSTQLRAFSASTRNGRLLCSGDAVNVMMQRLTFRRYTDSSTQKMLRLGEKLC